MKGTSTVATQEEYIAQTEEAKRDDLRTIHELIRRKLPDFEPFMINGFLGYGPFHYKTKSCEGDWMRVGLATNKTGFSIYICAGDENGHFPEQARDRLGKAIVGRSCIRFKKLSDINLDVVAELLDKTREANTMF